MIYIVINDISKIGGLSKVTLNLYQELKKHCRVKIITGHLNKEYKNYYKIAKEDIINLGLLSPHRLKNRVELAQWYLDFYYKLKNFSFSNEETLIGISTYMNFAIAPLQTRKIATEHTSYDRTIFTNALKRFFYKKVDKLVTLTHEDKIHYDKFLNNVEVIPNFVYPSTKVSKLKNGNILYVGNLNYVKGVDYLMKIIQATPYHFTIIGKGDGSLFKGLTNVTYKGELQDVENEFLNADLFILPSRKEGFPMVLLEAKNYGLPIVAFDVPTGPREIIKNGQDGYLVPLGNLEEFVQKINELMQHDKRRLIFGYNAKENIRNYYPKKVIEKWLRIID